LTVEQAARDKTFKVFKTLKVYTRARNRLQTTQLLRVFSNFTAQMSLRTRYRLHQFGNRLQVFFLGLLLGVVLSGGFFLLKLDDYVKDFAMNNPLINRDKDDEEPVTEDATQDDAQVKPKTNVNNVIDNGNQTPVTDSTAVSTTDDTASTVSASDPNSEIVVRTNELLGEKVVTLVNLDGIKAIDSIRSKEAGIKEEPGKAVTIEFWQSPLNYKGYTMSRSRLVLFGFNTEESVSLYRLDQTMFMKIAGGVFRLENTADFRQLERVTDEALLERLP
jgi:hypothetical protein